MSNSVLKCSYWCKLFCPQIFVTVLIRIRIIMSSKIEIITTLMITTWCWPDNTWHGLVAKLAEVKLAGEENVFAQVSKVRILRHLDVMEMIWRWIWWLWWWWWWWWRLPGSRRWRAWTGSSGKHSLVSPHGCEGSSENWFSSWCVMVINNNNNNNKIVDLIRTYLCGGKILESGVVVSFQLNNGLQTLRRQHCKAVLPKIPAGGNVFILKYVVATCKNINLKNVTHKIQ